MSAIRKADTSAALGLSDLAVSFRGAYGLPDQVAAHLGNLIVRGAFPGGAKLSEQELATAFGVSRTPVRDAIRILERDGLVEREPRKMARVTELTLKQARDVYVCRAYLYGLAARMAAGSVGEDRLRTLKSLAVSMRSAARSNDVDAYFEMNLSFHRTISEVVDNEMLTSLMDAMGQTTMRFRHLSITVPGRMKISADAHVELVPLLRAGEKSASERLVRRVIAEAGDAVAMHFFGVEQDDYISEITCLWD